MLISNNSHDKTTSTSRRLFLISGALLLAGCGAKKITSTLPSPIWDHNPKPIDVPAGAGTLPSSNRSIGAISRSSWAKGDPIPRKMNRMLPVKYITVHHDGMALFTSTSKGSASARLETIRKSHLRRDGGRWGDIGYHFAIDPAGRVWEGRSLRWQGAHVAARNEGNIGIVMLGNYEIQTTTQAQLVGLESTLRTLMSQYNVPRSRVRTHQEWAATACPGKHMQKAVVHMRNISL